MLTVKKKILLVRHGKTDWNVDVRFQGKTDIPLNEYGLEQARKTGVRLSAWRDALVVSSPLTRAMQTAGEIARTNKTIVPLDGLSEICFGPWEGAFVSDIRKSDKEALDDWHRDGFFNIPDGAETWDEVRSRVSAAVKFCLDSDEDRIIIVAHGGIIRAIMVDLVGIDPHIAWRLAVYNCSISAIDVCMGVNNLVILNDTLHLAKGAVNVPFNY